MRTPSDENAAQVAAKLGEALNIMAGNAMASIIAERLLPDLAEELKKAFLPAVKLEAMRRKRHLRPEEVEALYGWSTDTLKNWRYQKKGPEYCKEGNVITYPVEALEGFLESRRIKTRG